MKELATDEMLVDSGAKLVFNRGCSVEISLGPLGYASDWGNVRVGVGEGFYVLLDESLPGGGVELSPFEAGYIAGSYFFPVVELD